MVYVVLPGDGSDTFHDKVSVLAVMSVAVIWLGFWGTEVNEIIIETELNKDEWSFHKQFWWLFLIKVFFT